MCMCVCGYACVGVVLHVYACKYDISCYRPQVAVSYLSKCNNNTLNIVPILSIIAKII